MASIFTESEQEWLDRRAEKISAETGEPLPMARTQAMVQLVRLKSLPKAQVIQFKRRFRTPQSTAESSR